MTAVSKFLLGAFGVLFLGGIVTILVIETISAVFWIMQHLPPST